VLVDCINRKRRGGLNMFNAIVAGGQQRIRPIISTTVSTVGGILTLTITDKLWEGLGVVIIFGICFATVLTLIVVPLMYSIFEGVRYYIISAFRGPRWPDAPQGTSFYFSRRRYARLGLALFGIVQLVVLAKGISIVFPGFQETITQTTFQAPSTLKLAIEIAVFFIAMILKVLGVLVVLLVPTWVGLIFYMAKRSREGYFVDVTPEGVTLGSPVDRFFIEKDEISRVETARFFPSVPILRIYTGRRRIIIRKLVRADRVPEKQALFAWLAAAAPTRSDIRQGMSALKDELDRLVVGDSKPG
jgi:hypothetical protein